MTSEYVKTYSWKVSLSPEDGAQTQVFHSQKIARIKSSIVRTSGGEDSLLQLVWRHNIIKSHTKICILAQFSHSFKIQWVFSLFALE